MKTICESPVICSLGLIRVRSFCGHDLPFQGGKIDAESKISGHNHLTILPRSGLKLWLLIQVIEKDHITLSTSYYISRRNDTADLNGTIWTGRNGIIHQCV